MKYEKKARKISRNLAIEVLPDVLYKVYAVCDVIDSYENMYQAYNPINRMINKVDSIDVYTAKKMCEKGEHIFVNRSLYSHHGIYDGNGFVYEYNEGVVRKVTLEEFADGDGIIRVIERSLHTADTIIERAASRLGENDYNLAYNNCENFVEWCRLEG